MKKLKLVTFVCLLSVSTSLFAVPYDMILVGDPVLEDLRYLSLESGSTLLSFTPPLAPHEVERLLNAIDVSALSAPAREAFYRVQKRLNPEAAISISGDYFSMFVNVNAEIEARARSNTNIDWYPLYPEIPALLSVPVRFFFADTLQLYFEPSASLNPDDYSSNKNFVISTPFVGDNSMDGNFPLRAFIAAGGPWWNFQLGRDRLAFGTGISGNLAIADNPPFYEYMRLSFFSSFFKYSLLINQMPLRITSSLYPGLYNDDGDLDLQYEDSLTMSTQRYFYLHRVDFSLFDVLSIGLMEGLMVGNSALEIRYLNPFMLFHNFFSSYQYKYWDEAEMLEDKEGGHMNGSFFSVEINWNITKSLAAYGQLVMNEFASLGELATTKNQPPNGLGYMAGLQYSHSFDTWASLFFLEFIYTYPYLYMNSSPFASFIFMRSVSDTRSHSHYYYIGYTRDTIALTAGARFFDRDKLSFDGTVSMLVKGEQAGPPLQWYWERSIEAFNESTPSGTPEYNFIASVEAKWKPFSYLAFKGSLTGIFSSTGNSTETGGQVSFSVSFSY